jgi:hypothetical protein
MGQRFVYMIGNNSEGIVDTNRPLQQGLLGIGHNSRDRAIACGCGRSRVVNRAGLSSESEGGGGSGQDEGVLAVQSRTVTWERKHCPPAACLGETEGGSVRTSHDA